MHLLSHTIHGYTYYNTEPDKALMLLERGTSMIIDNQPDMYMQAAGGCVPQETVIKDVELAHAYVPFEIMCSTFMPLEALKKGTAFPPLYNVYGWERKGKGDDMYE
jgi:hypothetical protein